MRFASRLLGFLAALALVTPATTTLAQPSIVLQPVVTSMPTPPARNPVGLVNAGDGSGRLFLVIQQGEILVLSGGAVQSPAFLDIRTDVLCCDERGLLGVAFHPQFESNGFFWVYYTDLTGANVLARFQASPPSSGVVDPATRRVLFTDSQPGANHNGGQLVFGPDGFLYISKGDGGNAANGQSLSTRLGKILRIQPSLGTSAPFYTVPASNPFVGTSAAAPEIWAYGLRNTWRFTFDRLTGDMFPADVGEITREEVNFQPAGAAGGRNYGWAKMEGTLCISPSTNCNPNGAFVEPILEYEHIGGNCSITGGFRYRGGDFPSLVGTYFYADFCSGRIWGATESGGTWTTRELLDTTFGISSFGEDEDGELYVVVRAGSVHRITAAGGSPDLRIESLALSAASVAPGGQVTVSYNVANRGSTTVSQVYTDRIYLSSDSTLGGDVILGTSHSHTVPLAPNATHANSQAVTIPAGTTPGNYFVLVQADVLGTVAESNEGNNVTAIPITVTGTASADLRIESLALSAGSVARGSQVTVSYNVANRGSGNVNQVYTDRIYLSTDSTLSGDVTLGTSHGHTVPLAPNATHANSQAVTIPAGTTPGNYFVLVQADVLGTVAESNEGNNVTAIPITITDAGTTGRPDLVIEGLQLSSASRPPGSSGTVSYLIANRGSAAVTVNFSERIYLSSNNTLGSSDVTLATSPAHPAPLAAGATLAHSQAVTIPAGTAPGSYFILVQADAKVAIGESNEGNNVTAIPITVTP